MINKYRYGGDRQIYKKLQEDMLTTDFTREYPDEPLEFFDNWDKAATQLGKVAEKEALSDETKRTRFVTYFSVEGYTDELVDSVIDTISS